MNKAKGVQVTILAGVLGLAAWGVQAVEVEEATAAGVETFMMLDEGSAGGCLAAADFENVVFSKDDGDPSSDLDVSTTANPNYPYYNTLSTYCGATYNYSGANIDLWSQVVVEAGEGAIVGTAGAVDWTPAGTTKHAEGSTVSARGSCYYQDCANSSTKCGSDANGKIAFHSSSGSLACFYQATF